jgi:type VI secretion system protein ImpF
LCAGFFEVLTTTGKYYWVPTERVASIVFHPPRRPRDLAWRRATISVNEGPDGEVYIPVIYDSLQSDVTDDLRLGHSTEWSEEDTVPVRGTGQRVFLAGDDAYGIMDIAELRPQLPLLDRLIDDAPDVQRDAPVSLAEAAALLRRSVRRDIEALLNARRRWRSWPEGYDELAASPVGYGITDFAAGAFNDPAERDRLRSQIEQTIRRFEPRLAQVHVVLIDGDNTLDPTLRLRIEA